MVEKLRTDLLVIGAGSGGLSVAAAAVQMGANVILLEGHKMGGDCLNFGCVPSKALLAASKAAHAFRSSDVFGTPSTEPKVDYKAALSHVAETILQIEPHDSQERFEALGVRVIREFGRFVSDREVRAGPYIIRARRIVVATGSKAYIPDIEGLEKVPYLTNETLFDLKDTPSHLIIVGGGPIGVEMAQAHCRLGIQVTLLESVGILSRDDPEMVAVLEKRLRSEGVNIKQNVEVTKVIKSGAGVKIYLKNGEEVEGSHLLVAAGRQANLKNLDLSAAGVEHTEKGIQVSANLKTTNSSVYAIGDVIGGLQFTHVAAYHAGIILRSSLFALPSTANHAHIPYVTYTDPELAQVGLTENQGRQKYGKKLEICRFPYAGNDRAITERSTEGFIKILVVRGRVVGVSIVGRQAGELINFWSFVMSNRVKLSKVAQMIAAYPTLGEVNKRVAGSFFAPRLFKSTRIKKLVSFIQKWVP